jgi:hypothetical protein
MPEPPGYLQYARECKRLALQASDREDRELLLAMAKNWTKLAVDKSVPAPEQSAASVCWAGAGFQFDLHHRLCLVVGKKLTETANGIG